MLFPAVFLGGRVFYYRDVHLQWVGQMEALVRCVAAGAWPFWNPYASFGQPLLANPNYEVYYPPTWLNFVLRPWSMYRLFVFGHLWLAGVGAWLLARRLSLSPLAAGLAAVVWVASGPVVSLVSVWNQLAGAVWIPWVAWAAHRTIARPGRGRVLVWGATMAAPVLAGSPEMALFAVAFGVLVAIREEARNGWALPPLRRAAAAGLVALGLSAAQWAPSLELASRSARASLPEVQREFWSVPPVGLVQCVLPLFLDDLPLRDDVRAVLYESREPYLRSLYLGLPSVAMVAAALCSRRRGAAALAALVVALALVSLGRHAPLFRLFEAMLPLVRSLRFPAKAMVPAALAWALLSALGFDLWRRAARGEAVARAARATAVVVVGVAVGTAALLWWQADAVGEALIARDYTRRPFPAVLAPLTIHVLALAAAALVMTVLLWMPRRTPATVAALAAAIGGELVLANGSSTPVADPALFTFRPPGLTNLDPPPTGRAYSFDYFEPGHAERYLGHHGYLLKVPRDEWPAAWVEAAALRVGLYPSVLPQWGVEDGYRTDALGLYTPEMAALTTWLRRAERTPAHRRLLQLGAVTHVVSLHDAGLEDLTSRARLPSLFLEDLRVFAVPDPLPRAYVVDGVRVADTAGAARILADPGFDLRREIVLPGGPSAVPKEGFQGSARIVEWRPDRVTIDAQLSAAGYVVLVEAHDPSWRATVDERPGELLRANVAFRAVATPAGTHRIVFSCRPRAALAGLGATLATIVGAAAFLVWRRRTPATAKPVPA